MPNKIPFRAFETTTDTGVRTFYTLDGAVTDAFAMASSFDDGDTGVFAVVQAVPASTPNFEEFEGTFVSGSNRIDVDDVLRSSNGGSSVVWGSGTKDIYALWPAEALESFTDPAATFGLLARSSKDTYTPRTLGVSGPGTLLSISDGDGVAGNPTIVVSYPALSRSAASPLTDRKMLGQLVLGDSDLYVDTDDFSITGTNGPTDERIVFTRNADSDYDVQFGVDGSLVDALHTANSLKSILDTKQATTSGTQFTFTKPASITTVDKIEVLLDGTSLSGNDNLLIRIGDSGGIESTNYDGAAVLVTSTTNRQDFTNGFGVEVSAGSEIVSGSMTLNRIDTLDWTASLSAGSISSGGNGLIFAGGGRKSLSAALTQVQLLQDGASTFNNGSVNVRWWGV